MRQKIKQMWAAAPVATVMLFASLVVIAFFSVRIATNWVYWNDPAHRDQVIAGWMTPRYVAHSWQIPPEQIGAVLGVTRGDGKPQSLELIARARGVPTETLIAELHAAIQAHRAESARQ